MNNSELGNMAKGLVKVFLPVCLLAFLPLMAHAADPVRQYGQLQVKGAQLCDQQGQPVILRGVSLGWHNLWPRFYNKKVVQTLKQDWNCSVVRAAMGIMIEDNYLENPQYALQCMTPVIESAIKQNVYVIIDWHSHEMKTGMPFLTAASVRSRRYSPWVAA